MVLVPSPRARSWAKVKIAKHLFEHRYDYRAEWMRFTATLAQGAKEDGGDDDRNLHCRVAKALAQLTGSPGALLMLPAASGGFRVAEQWHWPGGVDELSPSSSSRCRYAPCAR